MKIWLDALTSKQALIMHHLEKEFLKRNHEVVITCRNYDYLVSLLRLKGSSPLIFGRYGETLEDKIRAGLEREMFFVNIWEKEGKPHLHISLTSPEAVRVAFRLKIPIIVLSDSPHSIYVNKLTMPLADLIIIPKCTPKEAYSYATNPEKIVQFDGLFEVMWIKSSHLSPTNLKALNIKPYEYIVIRPEEKKASYYFAKYEKPTRVDTLIKEVLDNTNVKIVAFPRYPDQRKFLASFPSERVIIPDTAVDSLPLLKYAIAVITGGETMATEAALLGTPAISFFPRRLHVMDYLIEKGFPFFHITDMKHLADLVLKIIDAPFKYHMDVEAKLRSLEDPTTIITRSAEELVTF